MLALDIGHKLPALACRKAEGTHSSEKGRFFTAEPVQGGDPPEKAVYIGRRNRFHRKSVDGKTCRGSFGCSGSTGRMSRIRSVRFDELGSFMAAAARRSASIVVRDVRMGDA